MTASERKDRKPTVCLVTGISDLLPIRAHLNNLVAQLATICGRVVVFSGSGLDREYDNVRLLRLDGAGEPGRGSGAFPIRFLRRVTAFLHRHGIIVRNLLRLSRQLDAVVFYVGASHFVLPVLCARLLCRKTLLIVTESRCQMERAAGHRWDAARYRLFEGITRWLANRIGVESPACIDALDLGRWRGKIDVFGAAYVDTTVFRPATPEPDRGASVGLIARLERAKGIREFLAAMPAVAAQHPGVRFLIGGDGDLFAQAETDTRELASQGRAVLSGWIEFEHLPSCLNRLAFLVLPSYSEGLPVIVQYGMACGAVVLATPVGGVPDLIIDGETGFIITDSSAASIEACIARALQHPDPERIRQNARRLIEREYGFDVCVRRLAHVLERERTHPGSSPFGRSGP